MKKLSALIIFSFLLLSGGFAQDLSKNKISYNIVKELKLFTDYLTNEIEYPEIAQRYNIEGTMIIRVVFDGKIRTIDVVQSLHPQFDNLVINKIKEFSKNWDRKDYEQIPLLTIKIPLHFKMEG
jgi:TonB family protein